MSHTLCMKCMCYACKSTNENCWLNGKIYQPKNCFPFCPAAAAAAAEALTQLFFGLFR